MTDWAFGVYKNKLLSNDNIAIYYKDAVVRKGQIFNDDDPFIYDGHYIITGVYDDRISEDSNANITNIDPLHHEISSYAFVKTHEMRSIEYFNQVTSIGDYVFYDNPIVSSIVLKNAYNCMNLSSNAFYRSGFTHLIVDLSSVNDSQQIGGYGLNTNALL